MISLLLDLGYLDYILHIIQKTKIYSLIYKEVFYVNQLLLENFNNQIKIFDKFSASLRSFSKDFFSITTALLLASRVSTCRESLLSSGLSNTSARFPSKVPI